MVVEIILGVFKRMELSEGSRCLHCDDCKGFREHPTWRLVRAQLSVLHQGYARFIVPKSHQMHI